MRVLSAGTSCYWCHSLMQEIIFTLHQLNSVVVNFTVWRGPWEVRETGPNCWEGRRTAQACPGFEGWAHTLWQINSRGEGEEQAGGTE
jgi:hypothetical protein